MELEIPLHFSGEGVQAPALMGYLDHMYDLPKGEIYEPDPNRVAALESLLVTGLRGFGVGPADRQAWDRWVNHPFGRFVLARAEELAEAPRPQVTNDLFLRVLEEQTPQLMNDVAPVCRERMSLLTLAECLRPDGRFLPVIEEDIRNAADLRTWIHPNNDRERDNFEGGTIFNDLASVHLAANLVTLRRLLGDRLSPGLSELIRQEVERRVLQPFEERIRSGRDLYWWFKVTHNWNSVCLLCTLICALELREIADQAWYLGVVERLIKYSEEGFPEDGFYTEGLSYWNYGFGHYIIGAELVRLVTAGEIDWLEQPLVRKMACFGERMEIQKAVYPTMADCQLGMAPFPWVANWLNNRILNTPDPARIRVTEIDPFGRTHHQMLPQALLVLFGMEDAQSAWKQSTHLEVREWFPVEDVLISRPGEEADVHLAATFKGGHNGVNHNHNDLGTFTVVVGDRQLVIDPGAEIYSIRTFSKDRYLGGLLNSYGHPVPKVAGQLQAPGAEASAEVIRTLFSDLLDEVVLDLTRAYPVDSLQRLVRTFRYHRSARPWVEVIDEVVFARPEIFETALITLDEWVLQEDGSVHIGEGDTVLKARIETEAGDPVFSHDLIDESTKPTRLAWTLPEAVVRATVRIVAEVAG